MGCNCVPTINEVTEGTLKPVEELLTEDNNSKRYVRLDRYFLNEQVDKLTYKGTLKATVFYEKKVVSGLVSIIIGGLQNWIV